MTKKELTEFAKFILEYLDVFKLKKEKRRWRVDDKEMVYKLIFKDWYTFPGRTPEDEFDEELEFEYQITKEQYELVEKTMKEVGVL